MVTPSLHFLKKMDKARGGQRNPFAPPFLQKTEKRFRWPPVALLSDSHLRIYAE